MPGKAAQIAFSYGSSAHPMPKVYHDSLMDIFELPHPAPYYSIAGGGPCHLDASSRNSLHAVCNAPALLVRRELYMPGWHADSRGKRLKAKPYGELFQSFNLPRGDSRLHFAYGPPYAIPAAFATLFALAALVAEFVFAGRRPRITSGAAV